VKAKIRSKIKYLVVFVCVIVLVTLLAPSYASAGSNSQVEAFVTRFYQLCLDRQPDQDGLNKWVGVLLDGSKTGADVAQGFIFSAEFTAKNYNNETFVTILYKAFFNRDPDPGGFDAWVSRLNKGTTRQIVLDGFTHSQEFLDLCSSYGILPFAGVKATTTSNNSSGGTITGTGSGFAAGNAVNFIIWGDDSGMGRPGGRVNGRTDINLFVHLNLDTHKAVIVSIPRDTWAPIPGHSRQKINGAHAIGGNDLAVRTFEQFTGMKLDFYAITDFDGFIPLINYLGGVTTTVEENIADSFSGCYLNAGTVTLDGNGALALCRARHGRTLYGGGAYAREHQAGMLIADLLIGKKGMVNSGNLGDFLGALSQFIWSNISIDQASRILPALLSMNREDITVTTFPSYIKNYGKASAIGYDEATKNAFFRNISMQ
jgi:LCP family protein required for cell wall assembly